MTNTFRITKGLDIPLQGEAEKIVKEFNSRQFAIKPTDFRAVFPKLTIKEGSEVKSGSILFYDKYRESIQFPSPVSGIITEIKRGEKRIIEEIRIEAHEGESVNHQILNPLMLSRQEITEHLLKSGVWPVIRRRPYSIIANPTERPKAIHIPGFDSAPLASDYDLIVHGKGEIFQTGLNALSKLTDGKVHLNLHRENTTSKVFINSKNVQINYFDGPHPSGNVSVHIQKIDPINKGDIVWYLYPQDVLAIGRLFLSGVYDASIVVALAGSEVKQPAYYKTLRGACVSGLIKNNITQSNIRVISGNPLTGSKIDFDGYIGFYDSAITVLPEGNHYEFMGWASPGFDKYSFSRLFMSKLLPGKRKYRMDTNLHGGERAYVMTGMFEKVMPLNIFPLHLIKACLIQDIDLMENLGIYEVDAEDFALCEFIDPSKTEIQQIIRDGLDLIRKEMS